jgi:hypothetical protein
MNKTTYKVVYKVPGNYWTPVIWAPIFYSEEEAWNWATAQDELEYKTIDVEPIEED